MRDDVVDISKFFYYSDRGRTGIKSHEIVYSLCWQTNIYRKLLNIHTGFRFLQLRRQFSFSHINTSKFIRVTYKLLTWKYIEIDSIV